MSCAEALKADMRTQKGFTLLEIVVVLAVLGALAAFLTPVVFRYIDDSNRARAQADVTVIAAAILQMYKDTGRWPAYATGTAALPFTSGNEAAVLTSNPDCELPEVWTACDTTKPVSGSGWDPHGTDKADSLARQLITNGPGYPTTGPTAWKGPYLDAIPRLDPWGRSYVVNIAHAGPERNGPTQNSVVVISAGADGILNTASSTAKTSNPVVAGDDVAARVM